MRDKGGEEEMKDDVFCLTSFLRMSSVVSARQQGSQQRESEMLSTFISLQRSFPNINIWYKIYSSVFCF